MNAKSIICTGSESRFLPICLCLLRSIRDQQQTDIDIGVLDLGLQPEESAQLSPFGPTIVKPGWDIDFERPAAGSGSITTGNKQIGEGFKAMVSRPFLREHFPGYETYIWIDADAWVQNWWAIEWLIEGARRGDLNIAPEMDRSYKHSFNFREYVRWTFEQHATLFGEKSAKRVAYNPTLNCGVFSMPANHPAWSLWADAMRTALSRKVDFFVDQLALNHVVYSTEPPRCLLPSQFNWLANMAMPAFDPVTRDFVEPAIPHRPIGILHLSGNTKSAPREVRVIGHEKPWKTWLVYDQKRKENGIS